MTVAITIPEAPDELFDLSAGALAPLNQLLRMVNEVRVVSSYPTGTNPKSPLRYTVSGNFVGVSALDDGIVEVGADCTALTFWNRLASEVFSCAPFFALRSVVDEGVETTFLGSSSFLTQYGTPFLLLNDAGVTGLERRNSEEWETVTSTSSYNYEHGDIAGPWMFRDLALLLSQLKYRQFLPTRISRGIRYGQFQIGPRDWDSAYSLVRTTGFNSWDDIGSGISTSDFTLYLNQSLVSYSPPSTADGYAGGYSGGFAHTIHGSAGYTVSNGLFGLRATVESYGVVGTIPHFTVTFNFNDGGPMEDEVTVGFPVRAGSADAGDAGPAPHYITSSRWGSISTANFPWDDHGLDDPKADRLEGMVVDRPFILMTPEYTYIYDPEAT